MIANIKSNDDGTFTIHDRLNDPENSIYRAIMDIDGGFTIQENLMDTWDTIFTGNIKWDGCSNFSQEANLHFCGFRMIKRFFSLIENIYRIKAFIGHQSNIDMFDLEDK